ncbi:MAG: RusA family crossover junction endodeoxyribonuclease [Anaerolineales bacterium]
MHSFSIKYPLFSKARPRLTKTGHAYMPPVYKNHQRNLREKIRKGWGDKPIMQDAISLELVLHGESRGDVDNIDGAFMDAAQGIIYVDDNCQYVSRLTVEWYQARKIDSCWHVTVAPYQTLLDIL